MDLIGSWGERQETAESCAERVLDSWHLFPQEPATYGPWGERQRIEGENVMPFVPIATDDSRAIKAAIVRQTEDFVGGPVTNSAFTFEFARRSLENFCTDGTERWAPDAKYYVRAGYLKPNRRFNRIVLQLNTTTDSSLVRDYLTTIVRVWEPDHVAVTTHELIKAQGRKTPQLDVGWLTYLRNNIPLDTAILGDDISLVAADNGRYLTIHGTPEHPNLEQIVDVRRALGYP